jgi:hypothetical protein
VFYCSFLIGLSFRFRLSCSSSSSFLFQSQRLSKQRSLFFLLVACIVLSHPCFFHSILGKSVGVAYFNRYASNNCNPSSKDSDGSYAAPLESCLSSAVYQPIEQAAGTAYYATLHCSSSGSAPLPTDEDGLWATRL